MVYFESILKVLLVGLILGAGLPALFATGMLAYSFGAGGEEGPVVQPRHGPGQDVGEEVVEVAELPGEPVAALAVLLDQGVFRGKIGPLVIALPERLGGGGRDGRHDGGLGGFAGGGAHFFVGGLELSGVMDCA